MRYTLQYKLVTEANGCHQIVTKTYAVHQDATETN